MAVSAANQVVTRSGKVVLVPRRRRAQVLQVQYVFWMSSQHVGEKLAVTEQFERASNGVGAGRNRPITIGVGKSAAQELEQVASSVRLQVRPRGDLEERGTLTA